MQSVATHTATIVYDVKIADRTTSSRMWWGPGVLAMFPDAEGVFLVGHLFFARSLDGVVQSVRDLPPDPDSRLSTLSSVCRGQANYGAVLPAGGEGHVAAALALGPLEYLVAYSYTPGLQARLARVRLDPLQDRGRTRAAGARRGASLT